MAIKTVKKSYRSLEQWQYRLEQCLQYVTEHGCKPWGKVGTEERKLYDWFYAQTKLYEKGKMSGQKESDFATLYNLIKKTEKKNVNIKATKKPKSKKSENKWKTNYDSYLKFLSENKRVPSGSSKDKEETQLAAWMSGSRYYLRKGKMLESHRREFEMRLAAMHELLEKVLSLKNKEKTAKDIEKQKKVEAIAIEKARKKEERKKREEEKAAKFNVTFPEHSDQKCKY